MLNHLIPHLDVFCPLSLLTLSATSLQTLFLSQKIVLVAQTPSELENLAAHQGGVVVVPVLHPKTWSCVWFCFTSLYRERKVKNEEGLESVQMLFWCPNLKNCKSCFFSIFKE